MSLEHQEEKPCLLPAGQGFSLLNTVKYKGRFLYSKYDPKRSLLSLIQNTTFLPGSLILLCSPALWYGLEELENKLPSDSYIVAIEGDEELFNFSAAINKGIDFYSKKNIGEFYSKLKKLINTGKVKRAIRLDFSAGIYFEKEFYLNTCYDAEQLIASFWKNRLTITKMGRLFAKNIFKNLPLLPNERTFSSLFNSVNKPILLLGAGESLDESLKYINEKSYYIIAVDAALNALQSLSLRSDAVVGVEAQYAIQEAYIGCQKSANFMFADICSRPSVTKNIEAKKVWFASEYADCRYLKAIQKLGLQESFIPPLGSVGLTALYIALKLRKDSSIPIFVTGLDFSFSAGKTHSYFAPAGKRPFYKSSRLNPYGSYDAAFSENAKSLMGKQGEKVYTNIAMLSYAENFNALFAKVHNIFDIGKSGIPLCLQQANIEMLSYPSSENQNACPQKQEVFFEKGKIQDYLEEERQALEQIKDLLSSGEKSSFRDKNVTLSEQLEKLLLPRDYLYLHFPDGYKFSLDPAFLRRVRAELDVFLRILGK